MCLCVCLHKNRLRLKKFHWFRFHFAKHCDALIFFTFIRNIFLLHRFLNGFFIQIECECEWERVSIKCFTYVLFYDHSIKKNNGHEKWVSCCVLYCVELRGLDSYISPCVWMQLKMKWMNGSKSFQSAKIQMYIPAHFIISISFQNIDLKSHLNF